MAATKTAIAPSTMASSAAPFTAAARGELLLPRPAAIGTPLRAFLERLSACSSEGCPWQGYLPAKCREDLLQSSAAEEADKGSSSLACRQPGLLCRALGDGPVAGRVWSLSRDAAGCRLVQNAIEEAENDQEREALASELRGHVWEALQCPHANHVLQKCVLALRPDAVQFVIDELSARGGVLQAARHKYGCRIVQRLIELLPWSQTEDLVELLLREVSTVSRHAYGNYVMQNLLQHGTEEQRTCILRAVESDLRLFASDPYGAAVVGASLLYTGLSARLRLAAALVEDEGLLESLACTRLGYGSVEVVLEVLSPVAREEGIRQLRAKADVLLLSRFGRLVLESLPLASSGDEAADPAAPSPSAASSSSVVCSQA